MQLIERGGRERDRRSVIEEEIEREKGRQITSWRGKQDHGWTRLQKFQPHSLPTKDKIHQSIHMTASLYCSFLLLSFASPLHMACLSVSPKRKKKKKFSLWADFLILNSKTVSKEIENNSNPSFFTSLVIHILQTL